MIRPILRHGASALHQRAASVEQITPDTMRLIDDMVQTMSAAPGIGLAAPQVGEALRIFVADLSVGRNRDDLIIFVNPEFVERDGMQLEQEGCLSVPGFEATVARPARVVVKGLDREGRDQVIEGTGLLARCFQHEMDHLEGTLFVDRLRGLQKDLILQEDSKAVEGRKMVERLRIVFFGTPQFAVPTLASLIASRHVVCGVVTQPDRPSGRGQKVSASPVKTLALEQHLSIAQPQRLRDAEFLAAIRDWQPDLGVVAAYGKLIPEDLLALPRFGMINVHASLLPKYRGAAPIQRAIIDGELETGVTIMRMVKELDAGRMLAKVSRPLGPDETADAVERDLADLGAPLLVSVVDRLASGEEIPGEIQDYMVSSYAPRLTKEEGRLDWTLPATFIHNRVRGLYPWPQAHTYLDGNRLIVLRTSVEGAQSDLDPGTVIDASGDAIHVATGHRGQVAITELQPEGRRPMTAKDFLAGHPVRRGARFTDP